MILSLKHKFLFKHVPRTAGKSIMNTLTPYCDIVKAGHADMKAIRGSLLSGGSWRFLVDCKTPGMEQVEIYGKQLCVINRPFRMSRKEYDELFTFAFIRNPWSRELSRYLFITKRPQHIRHREVMTSRSFEGWLRYLYKHPHRRQNQLDMLTDKNGKMITTLIGKYENLQQDFNKVCVQVGVPRLELFHIDLVGMENLIRKDFGQYRKYYNAETRRLVGEICKIDIEYFDYKF